VISFSTVDRLSNGVNQIWEFVCFNNKRKRFEIIFETSGICKMALLRYCFFPLKSLFNNEALLLILWIIARARSGFIVVGIDESEWIE